MYSPELCNMTQWLNSSRTSTKVGLCQLLIFFPILFTIKSSKFSDRVLSSPEFGIGYLLSQSLYIQWDRTAFPCLWSRMQNWITIMFWLHDSTQFFCKGKPRTGRGWWDLSVLQGLCCFAYLLHSLNTPSANNPVFHFYHHFKIH